MTEITRSINNKISELLNNPLLSDLSHNCDVNELTDIWARENGLALSFKILRGQLPPLGLYRLQVLTVASSKKFIFIVDITVRNTARVRDLKKRIEVELQKYQQRGFSLKSIWRTHFLCVLDLTTKNDEHASQLFDIFHNLQHDFYVMGPDFVDFQRIKVGIGHIMRNDNERVDRAGRIRNGILVMIPKTRVSKSYWYDSQKPPFILCVIKAMATRRAIQDQLESYHHQISKIILSKQNPCTGLIPASVAITTHGDYRDAWVRDNVYSIIAVWGLSLAYRRIDDDGGVGYELEHATIKCMRGLLYAMMQQSHKVENFKNTQSLEHSLHAKYNTATGAPVVGDFEWGHLQIDATSLFLLTLAQMTTSGLHIVYTMDEVNFVQNLVFYIERAYRTPDYGIWERGNKINHGMPELNSSSIGMALAALQAINGVNLFGAKGGPSSVIHVLPDELTRNYTTLHSALPRESNSKEVDAALLSVISFPAFAVQDPALMNRTRNEIIKKLGGRYGCKRFLRDGHQTVLEDHSRLHYDPNELKVFEHIECEWPLFFTYLMLDGYFRNDLNFAEEYRVKLDGLSVSSARLPSLSPPLLPSQPPTGIGHSRTYSMSSTFTGRRMSIGRRSHMSTAKEQFNLIPELYIVPRDRVDAEKENPGSQPRVPNENVPLVWAQSLYFLGNLIADNLLSPAEMDPLGRRLLPFQQKNSSDVVVQVVLLAESEQLRAKLNTFGLETQTVEMCQPVTISPPSVLREAYTALGENQKMGLTGRPRRPVGTIGTSKLYRCQGRLYAFLPHFMDKEEFYLVSDNDYLVSVMEQEIAFVKNHWWYTGRPTLMVMLTNEMLGTLKKEKHRYGPRANSNRNLLNFVMSLKSGMCGGTRVRVGRLSEMIGTACVESLDFLVGAGEDWHNLLKGEVIPHVPGALSLSEKSTHLSMSTGSQTPNRRRAFSRRRSFDGSTGSKSPLASPFFTDDYNDMGAEVSELMGIAKLDIGPSSVGAHKQSHARTLSPDRESLRKKSMIGDMALNEHTDSARRQSYQLESIPISLAVRTDGAPNYGSTPTATSAAQSPDFRHKSSNTVDSNFTIETEVDFEQEMLTLTLNDPKHVPQAISLLRSSANLYDQIDLLQYLHSCHGLDFYIDELGTVSTLLEEVYSKAMHMGQWSIVRQTAGLLMKVVNSLTINVADLLIRQKPVTVGFGSQEYFMTSPLSPSILSDIVFRHCASDVREAPVVQEVLTYLGSFIRSQPNMFEGIMRIRTHFFIIAMREEISRMRGCDEEEAVEQLMQLSPFEMKQLLSQVLTAREQTNLTTESSLMMLSTMKQRSFTMQGHPQSDLKLTTSSSLPNELTIVCQSGGFQAGNFCRIELKLDQATATLPIVFGRGMNVLVVDPFEGTIIENGSFDTHVSHEDADELARLIEWLEPGTLVLIVCKDDASECLTEAAKIACESIGSTKIRELTYRDSWCILGEKGAEKGSVPESHKVASAGPTDIVKRVVDLAARRKKLLATFPGVGEVDVSSAGSGAGLSIPLKNVNVFSALLMPSNGRWLRRRKNDGALNRVPTDFYPKVWRVLSKCNGILVGKEFLPRDPTVSEKTPEEFNFALQVESLLDVIRDPAERQIAVECLVVISRIEDRNPEISINSGTLDLNKIVRDAVSRFWSRWIVDGPTSMASSATTSPATPTSITKISPTGSSASGGSTKILSPTLNETTAAQAFDKNEKLARRLFYDLPQDGPDGTMSFLATSCVRLVFDVLWSDEK
ncbi:hypothetical protein HK098_004590 [Nowakowskiella sp. JEL0407]|nr:hypothetical protein HK098_004590 [Nowakowskiella sp. JEL0407]